MLEWGGGGGLKTGGNNPVPHIGSPLDGFANPDPVILFVFGFRFQIMVGSRYWF